MNVMNLGILDDDAGKDLKDKTNENYGSFSE